MKSTHCCCVPHLAPGKDASTKGLTKADDEKTR
jgi:hypothetical protein